MQRQGSSGHAIYTTHGYKPLCPSTFSLFLHLFRHCLCDCPVSFLFSFSSHCASNIISTSIKDCYSFLSSDQYQRQSEGLPHIKRLNTLFASYSFFQTDFCTIQRLQYSPESRTLLSVSPSLVSRKANFQKASSFSHLIHCFDLTTRGHLSISTLLCAPRPHSAQHQAVCAASIRQISSF